MNLPPLPPATRPPVVATIAETSVFQEVPSKENCNIYILKSLKAVPVIVNPPVRPPEFAAVEVDTLYLM